MASVELDNRVVLEIDKLLADLDAFIVEDGGIFDEAAMDRFRERIHHARWHLASRPDL